MGAARARWEFPAVALVLACLAAVLVSLAWRVGVTVDEPSHLLSAQAYWRGEDRLKPGDMPPLIKITGGWVPALLGLPIPYDREDIWETQHEWSISLEMMQRMSGERIRRVFFLSRLPLLIYPLLCCGLLWWWARQLFGPAAGLVVAACFAMSPNVLGHGVLFKNDLAASFAYLLFWYRAWVFWRDARTANAVWLGGALVLGVMAKFSLLVLAPIAPAIVVARHLTRKPIQPRALAMAVAGIVVVLYIGVAAAWQFDVRPLPAETIREWKASPEVPRAFLVAAKVIGLLPTPPRFWEGAVSLILSNATGSGVYVLGTTHPTGHPLYFLIALAVKVPAPLQLLILGGALAAVVELLRRRMAAADLFWLAPPVLYVSLASVSSLQLGVRLVLPALAFLVLLAGMAVRWCLSHRFAKVLPAVLLCWQAARAVQSYPYYLSFFNIWTGGPEHGAEYLSDSNLDWGQDLPELAEFVRRNRIERIRLAYFGTDNPYGHIPERNLEIVAPPWTPDLVRETRFQPEAGYYAISATLLTGQLFPEEYRDYFQVFRALRPVGRAGYSIFVYRVP